ncbi:MAG: hypothetical protein KME15_21495 [Drouetiella hepatica Uher 2000/2452]|jgi:hypothetical protein|uniref:Secreted protein n=1 Tax=Drouetiella hepatica Uher 2000/2452 TaxID=904376 RepID=A0A951QDH3_9CYAN|nr:hypothetical protein [Drouetiella hepatica Uher 2000/2452]
MNHKILLSLVAIPAMASSLLALPLLTLASAATESSQTWAEAIATPLTASCDLLESEAVQSLRPRDHETLIASAINIPIEYPETDFSAAESDAAVTLFGCDCSSCIRALQQLRRQTLLNNSGHCWSALQKRATQSEMQEVLDTLESQEMKEAEEASQKP